ncbi:Uncharacterised protein [Rhodococcus erythropolis]|nr:Uncharacterised protein [Rhodococcus erythropolis]
MRPRIGQTVRRHPGMNRPDLERADHLLGSTEHTAALFVGCVVLPGQAVRLQSVPMLAKDLHRFLVLHVRDPRICLCDRAAIECRSQEQCRQQILSFRIEECVRLRFESVVTGGEMIGQVGGPDFVGHPRERIPPPARFLIGDPLRIEHPDLRAHCRSNVAGRVDDIALVRRRQDCAGSIENCGDDATGRLTGARTPNIDVQVLPAAAQHRGRPEHRLARQQQVPELDADNVVGTEPHLQGFGFCPACLFRQRSDVATAAHVLGQLVDAGAVPLAQDQQPHAHCDQHDQRQGEGNRHYARAGLPHEIALDQARDHRHRIDRNILLGAELHRDGGADDAGNRDPGAHTEHLERHVTLTGITHRTLTHD